MPPVRQSSFAGGELAKAVQSRDDLDVYGVGARRLRNFFVSKQGAAVSRPGTKYIAETKTSAKKSRLLRFVYSDSQSYAIEFGDLYVRFYSAGGQVLLAGVPYEIVSPYAEADLFRLKVAQVGDVLTITHPSYAPRELRRTTHTSWAFSTISFDARPAEFPTAPGIVLTVADATHPAREWIWKLTNLWEVADGVFVESAPHTVVLSTNGSPEGGGRTTAALATNNVAVYPDMPVEVDWSSNGLFGSTYRVVAWRVYRGRGNLFGLVGETGMSCEFKDYGAEPDYAQPPPQGRNPFSVYDAGGVLVRTEEPTAVTFFESRRVFGGTAERPGHLFASQTDDYANFDERVVSTADESIELEIATKERHEIRAVVGLQKLIVLTNAGAFALSGSDGIPMQPTDLVESKQVAGVGCSWVDPLEVEGSLLYPRTKGTGVRVLSPAQTERGQVTYQGGDISVFAADFFVGFTVDDWCYAEDPWGLVWAVRSDGKLLSLTFSREHQLLAWALHETDGVVESVCSIPETTEDAVYLVVKRTIDGADVRYVERMTNRVVVEGSANDVVCLDCAATYSGAPVTSVSGLDHLEGEEVYALADGQVVGPLTVEAGAIALGIDPGASTVHVGLRYLPTLELLDVPVARTKQKRVAKVNVDVHATRGLWVGEDEASLKEWRQRTVGGGVSPPDLETTQVEVAIAARWNVGGRAVLQQQAPLPLTVLGVTREVEGGG